MIPKFSATPFISLCVSVYARSCVGRIDANQEEGAGCPALPLRLIHRPGAMLTAIKSSSRSVWDSHSTAVRDAC